MCGSWIPETSGAGSKGHVIFSEKTAAHRILDEQMNDLVGVEACHPEEYLLPETHEEVRAQRSKCLMQVLPEVAPLEPSTEPHPLLYLKC